MSWVFVNKSILSPQQWCFITTGESHRHSIEAKQCQVKQVIYAINIIFFKLFVAYIKLVIESAFMKETENGYYVGFSKII